MRCKITVIGTGPVATATAAELLSADDAEVVLLGLDEAAAGDLRAAAELHGVEPRARAGGWETAPGSEIVVVLEDREDAARELAARCPGAVAVVATEDVAASVRSLLDGTRWPRGRVVGIAGAPAGPLHRAAAAWRIVDAIVRDRQRTLECTVRLDGASGAVGVAPARLGNAGIEAIG